MSYDVKADEEARKLFQQLRKKSKTENEIGKAIDSAIDLYFEIKRQKEQLEFCF